VQTNGFTNTIWLKSANTMPFEHDFLRKNAIKGSEYPILWKLMPFLGKRLHFMLSKFFITQSF
jgi:hypothetical protein